MYLRLLEKQNNTRREKHIKVYINKIGEDHHVRIFSPFFFIFTGSFVTWQYGSLE